MRAAAELDTAELEQVQRRLQFTDSLLRGTSDGLIAFDLQYRYLYWNAAMERLLGVPATAVLGACAFDVFPFLRENGAERCLAAALEGSSATLRDASFPRVGSTRKGVYEGFYEPLRTDDGRIVGGTGLIRDISARKEAEQQLVETETRFQNMADVSPVLLWMSGTDGLCTFFNQTWLNFTGRTLEREWGVGWAEGVHYEDFQRCMDTYVAAFNRREVFEMEYRLRRADGSYRWILDRGTPRYTPDGTFAGFIGSCVDITDHKGIELTLRKAVSDRDDFLAIASHELRTPLTAVRLSLDSLQRSMARRPEEAFQSGRFAKGIESLSKQTDRLAAMVGELLDVTRITAGRLQLEYEELDFSALVQEVAARLQPALEDSGSVLHLQHPPALRGFWDRVRLDRVLTNLLGNAVKYGAGKPIEVTLQEDGERVRLSVRDQGIGIPPEDQARIFERFERAVPVQHFGGFGLGLWIAREIVEAFGGSISVRSEPGRGATFTIELPRNREPPAGAAVLTADGGEVA